MKRLTERFSIILVFLLASCQGKITSETIVVPVSTENASPTFTDTIQRTLTPTRLLPSPTLTITTTTTSTGTATPTVTPTFPPEARFNFQCLEVEPNLPIIATSSGIVVMQNKESVVGRSKPDTFLLDLATGKSTQIALPNELLRSYAVSPNRKYMAFSSVMVDKDGKMVRMELVIATAEGQRLITIPWEEDWVAVAAWLDNTRLVIPRSGQDPEVNILRKPGTLLIFNPFSGERQILRADFPGFLYTSSTVLPDWEGWFGVIYDPTLTRAIYPRFIEKSNEKYTYAIWDMSKNQLVASLEAIFTTFATYNFYPMPRWSPDGSQFVFLGVIAASKQSDPVEYELYSVRRDGQTERLTHLAGIAYIWESSYSWSPDGQHIVMFLGPSKGVLEEKARVAVLDTKTLEVTDYCIALNHAGVGYGVGPPPLPIWSPDGKQFLVVDWYDKDHQNTILVDIEKGFAAVIAKDMEPVGWLLSEK